MSQNIGSLGKKGTSISGMPLAKSTPSLRTLHPISLSICKDLIKYLNVHYSLLTSVSQTNDTMMWIVDFGLLGWSTMAGPFCTDTQTRMCHWAPGSQALKWNTWTSGPCVVGPHQVLLYYIYYQNYFGFFFFHKRLFMYLIILGLNYLIDCEWKAQEGTVCVASFDWQCSGICKSVERMKTVHNSCGEGNRAVWNWSADM